MISGTEAAVFYLTTTIQIMNLQVTPQQPDTLDMQHYNKTVNIKQTARFEYRDLLKIWMNQDYNY